jgi:hypothetical protein
MHNTPELDKIVPPRLMTGKTTSLNTHNRRPQQPGAVARACNSSVVGGQGVGSGVCVLEPESETKNPKEAPTLPVGREIASRVGLLASSSSLPTGKKTLEGALALAVAWGERLQPESLTYTVSVVSTEKVRPPAGTARSTRVVLGFAHVDPSTNSFYIFIK